MGSDRMDLRRDGPILVEAGAKHRTAKVAELAEQERIESSFIRSLEEHEDELFVSSCRVFIEHWTCSLTRHRDLVSFL